MNIFTTIRISIRAILSNKVRSFLTVLGIIIGITAVIALLSLGQGAQSQILNTVETLGSNSIIILPVANINFTSRSSLSQIVTSKIDHRVLKILENKTNFPEIVAISAEINSSLIVSSRFKNDNYTVVGVSADDLIARDLEVATGRFFNQSDTDSVRKIAVLGSESATKLFGESDPLGEKLKIGNNSFNVVGVMKPKNSEFDGRVYIPVTTSANIVTGIHDYSTIVVKVSSEDIVDFTSGKIEQQLNQFYKVTGTTKAPFSVITTKDILALTSTITGVFTALLASIASISLVVGGIGIMNIMLVSVSERTKEIGLRKAIGAKQNAILSQFLTEAVILTLIGGAIGIVLGIALAYVVGYFSNIPVIINISSILLATSVSATIGIVFGFYPAARAARLDPIVALRYE